MDRVDTEGNEEKLTSEEASEVTASLQQEVQEIKEAVDGVVQEQSVSDKVEVLRTNLENLSEDVQSWKTWRKDYYVEALESLKSQVEEIENEWETVATSMKAQRDRLESMLDMFSGVIETTTIRALSLRLNHLEKLVSGLIEESNTRSTTASARKQLIISLVALGITTVFWIMFATGNLYR